MDGERGRERERNKEKKRGKKVEERGIVLLRADMLSLRSFPFVARSIRAHDR